MLLHDVITGSIGEFLGGLALLLVVPFSARARRRAFSRRGAVSGRGSSVPAAVVYTLIGTRAPDGHPVRLVSTRPVGTVVTHGCERFELTGGALSDGTFAAEPLSWYR
ncbi:hypothetical protein [Streptomyces sp. SPB4]|uniref:hypothetical protein n=1 Tax=Streptomyces sp. SPB4 TaxID=2940553 RepID=UPI002474736D|nr:hypothetical protein [Streptomyces sp. SPB4]MDH6544943.1 hypothetical protein [Streptomyces sp. SPB4]